MGLIRFRDLQEVAEPFLRKSRNRWNRDNLFPANMVQSGRVELACLGYLVGMGDCHGRRPSLRKWRSSHVQRFPSRRNASRDNAPLVFTHHSFIIPHIEATMSNAIPRTQHAKITMHHAKYELSANRRRNTNVLSLTSIIPIPSPLQRRDQRVADYAAHLAWRPI